MSAYLLDNLGPWTWVVAGLVCMGLELLAPGIFLFWIGLAAVGTGLVMGLFALSWQAAALVFAVLAVAGAIAGRMLAGGREERADDGPALNRRGHALVGRIFTLEAPIIAGEGRIRVDDSSWRIVGPNAPEGARVRVVRVDGATLVVETA